MPENIEKSRYGCNLQGALQTLGAIQGVVPILHSTPGCGIQNYIANRAGGNGAGYLTGYSVPDSNVYEKQVIFGGTSRLREQIKNTVKVMKGDLYVTLSGCESEMVGDDIVSMTQEIVDQGEKAIYYKGPGFKGDQYIGYEGIVDAVISQLPAVSEANTGKDERLVNLFGIIPKQDICWQGNLDEIERILNSLGIKVNKLFGYKQDAENWRKIPSAGLNIAVSKWGRKAVEKLESLYGTPYLYTDTTGLGLEDIERFIRSVSDKLGFDGQKTEEYLAGEKGRFTHALSQIAEYYFDYDFQRQAVLVGDESTITRYAGLLAGYFGMELQAAIITDFTGDAGKQAANKTLSEFVSNIIFEKDGREIDKIIANTEAEIIFGSSLENAAAGKRSIPNHIISYPAFGKVIIGKSDTGYTGALNVIEEISSVLVTNKL